MGRIAEKNPRFRTKDQICKDLSLILKIELTEGTKMAVLNEIFWVWSEFNGKIKGCKYWSKKATKSYNVDKKVKLIHEHIVPRDILRKKIFELNSPSPESLMKILNTYCIGVVVTKGEDSFLNKLKLKSKMPENWNGIDVWARHKMANIVLEEQKTKYYP